MDPLEFFDEEYSNFNNSVEEVNSLVFQSKEIYNKFVELEKSLSVAIQSKNLNIDSINSILASMESLIKNSKEFIIAAEKSSNTIQRQWN